MKKLTKKAIALILLFSMLLITSCSSNTSQLFGGISPEEEAKTKYDEAVKEFEEGNFARALDLFESAKEYYPYDRYKTAIEHLKKFTGKWSASSEEDESLFKNKNLFEVTFEISGPYKLNDYSTYSDCDWSVSVNVSIFVDKATEYGDLESFYINQPSSLDHVKSSADTEMSDFFLVRHDKYGQHICNYKLKGWSEIYIAKDYDFQITLSESVKDPDFSESRGFNSVSLLRKSIH